ENLAAAALEGVGTVVGVMTTQWVFVDTIDLASEDGIEGGIADGQPVDYVSPAHAGMDLDCSCNQVGIRTAPRTCGDMGPAGTDVSVGRERLGSPRSYWARDTNGVGTVHRAHPINCFPWLGLTAGCGEAQPCGWCSSHRGVGPGRIGRAHV